MTKATKQSSKKKITFQHDIIFLIQQLPLNLIFLALEFTHWLLASISRIYAPEKCQNSLRGLASGSDIMWTFGFLPTQRCCSCNAPENRQRHVLSGAPAAMQ